MNEPVIIAAWFEPNPAGLGLSTTRYVQVLDAAVPETPTEDVWLSGERESGVI